MSSEPGIRLSVSIRVFWAPAALAAFSPAGPGPVPAAAMAPCGSGPAGCGLGQTCGMASWAQFETQAPELAGVAARLWPGIVALYRGAAVPAGLPCFAVSYLATVRRDGGPAPASVLPGSGRRPAFRRHPAAIAQRMGPAQGPAVRDPRAAWPRG